MEAAAPVTPLVAGSRREHRRSQETHSSDSRPGDRAGMTHATGMVASVPGQSTQ